MEEPININRPARGVKTNKKMIILFLLLGFGTFVCIGKRKTIPLAYVLAAGTAAIPLFARYPWWIGALVFLVLSFIITKIMAEEYDMRKLGKPLKISLATLVVLVIAAAITDQTMTNNAVKGNERIAGLVAAISCDAEHYQMHEIKGYSLSEDKNVPVRDFPAPYVCYFLDASGGSESLAGKSATYSGGMFPSPADIAGVKTVVVAVRYASDGYTYVVNGNQDHTKQIFRKKGNLYFFNLETKEYHVMKEVVAGKLPGKRGGGRTSFTRYRLLGAMKDMYSGRQ